MSKNKASTNTKIADISRAAVNVVGAAITQPVTNAVKRATNTAIIVSIIFALLVAGLVTGAFFAGRASKK